MMGATSVVNNNDSYSNNSNDNNYTRYISQGSTEKQSQENVYIEKERELYFKELVHSIMEASMSRICNSNSTAIRLETEERANVAVQIKTPSAIEFLSAWERSDFLFSKPQTDGMRTTHVTKDNLLSSKSINLNVNLIQNHLHRNIQNNI